jgi:hypothetical protein
MTDTQPWPPYAPAGIGRLQCPMGISPLAPWGTGGAVANLVHGMRYVITRSGYLRNIVIMTVATGGNLDVGVYSTAATRQLLWHLAAPIATPAANGWRVLAAAPDIGRMVSAGEHLDFAFVTDSNSPTFGRQSTLTGQLQLTALLTDGGGAAPNMGWSATVGVGAGPTLPSTVAEADMNVSSATIFALYAEVV